MNGETEKSLASQVAALAADVTSLKASVQQLLSAQKTQWGPLASWAGVIFAIGSVVVGSIYLQLRETNDMAKNTHTLLFEREHERGRRDQMIDDTVTRLETLTAAMSAADKDLDEVLQREMRLLNATTDEKVNALDMRLQSEISRNNELVTAIQNRQSQQVQEVSENQAVATRVWAELTERVRNLQEEVRRMEAQP